MGEVFAAENIRTGRPVAVKLLRSDSKTKSSAVARFRREARAAGSINSDHVTQVLDVEEDSEHGIVLVFELLEGESLIDRLKRTGPIPFDELHGIIEQVWIGLADAHKAGIIHRDLKPSNVFLERRPDGQTRVKILDFGISKLPKEMGGETLTEMGQSLGTFSFMPPEQIGKAKTVDHRADIYACGTLIYQALSGQLPYVARNILVMVEMKSKTDPRRLADAMGSTVDPRLEAFLAKTLARDPNQRFQNATEAMTEWRELRPSQPTSSPQAGAPGAMARPATPVPDKPAVSPRMPGGSSPQGELPDAMETTTDTAATIAMPLSHLTGGADLPRAPSPQGQAPSSQGPNTQGRNLAGLKRTMPMQDGDALVQQVMRERAQNQAYGPPPAPPPPPAAATPTPGPAYRPTPQPQPAIRPAQPTHQTGGGRFPYEDSTSQPPSQDKTRVYQPTNTGQGGAMVRTDPPGVGRTLPLPLQKKRSAVPFVLGAIAFALVGFSIVALVLRYLSQGHF